MTLPRGRSIGRYVLIDRLGAGGMGEVFSAYDPELDRKVAVKLLRVGTRRHAARAQARLLREAQALAKLSHPNVVAIFDAGTHEGGVFLAMEYLDGVTLGQWLDDDARTWRAALAVLVEAGRGLAAAHAGGLVHRDFKPGNVMVARAEAGVVPRVCVLDFGLARSFDEPVESSDGDGIGSSGSNVDTGSLTETGVVMGTPKFMAPEQFAGGSIDARTDQFAFCIVAWLALYGQAPFLGHTFGELSLSVRQAAIVPPPRESPVPREVRLALERGLQVDPEARFADMHALLHALQQARAVRRRRKLTLAGIAAGVVVATGIAIVIWPREPCRGIEDALVGVWDDGRRDAIASAFASTDVPYAGAAQQRIGQTFDAYAQEWMELRTAACTAARDRDADEDGEIDLRIACLDARLHELGALGDVLAAADAQVVEHAVTAARNLPPLQACADGQQWLVEVPQPTDPTVHAEVTTLRATLGRAHALVLTGGFTTAIGLTEPVLTRARDLGYAPLLAEASVALGRMQENRGRPEAAIACYEEGLWAAVESGHWRAEAEALIGLASVMSNHTQQPELALRQLRHARAVLERMGNPQDLLARLLLSSGTTHYRMRHWDEAEDEYRRTIEVAGDRPALEQVRLAALSNLAASRGERGRYREATEAILEAVELAEATLGEVHPLTGRLYNNLGATYARMGRGPEAIAQQRKALAIYEAAFGETHPEVGRAQHNLGVGLSESGDYEAALTSYRKALAIKRETLGPDDPSVAHSANNCGDALVRLGRPEEAVPLLEDALRIWALQPGSSPDAAYAIVSLAEARLALGEPEAALPLSREALALAREVETDPIHLARTQFAAAMAIEATGGDRQEAIELAVAARTGFQSPERHSARELARIEAWLEKVANRGH